MTIHIYGDSFGAEYDDDETWPVVLSNLKKEEAVIYAQAGTGPNWSLKMFIDHLENDEIKNFCEMVLTEEPEIVNLIAQDDGAATIEALTEDALT